MAASDAPVELSEKRNILQQLAQLEIKVHELERERIMQLFSKHSEFRTDGSTLEEVDIDLNEKRKEEKRELTKHLSKLRHQVIKFKKLLRDIKSTTTYVESLKVGMESVENGLIDFKENYKKIYEVLVKDEGTLLQEITAYERRFDLWDSNDEIIVIKPSKSHGTVDWQPPTTLPAVKKFEEYVQKCGHLQGWDSCDHDAFIKALNKHKGQHQKFIRAALSDLPGFSTEQVEDHHKWYTTYCVLLEDKRAAIQQWRSQQETNKDERLKHAKQSKHEIEQVKFKQEVARKKKMAAEREECNLKLAEWKKEQILKQRLSQEALAQQATHLAKQKEKDNARRLAIKQQVSDYTTQRTQERGKLLQLQEEQSREEMKSRKLANEEAKKFAERDFRALEAKLDLQKQKSLEESNRKSRIEKARKQPLVKRDPSRLCQLTSGWEQRLKQTKEHKETPCSISAMPKRAVPAWRQGM